MCPTWTYTHEQLGANLAGGTEPITHGMLSRFDCDVWLFRRKKLEPSGERGESGEETNEEEDVDDDEDSDGEMEHDEDLLIFDRNEL